MFSKFSSHLIGAKPWRWLVGVAAVGLVAQLGGLLAASSASALTPIVHTTVLPFVGLNHPDDVVFDQSDNTYGALFVADTNNNRVVELYDGHQTILPFVGLNGPRGLALVYSIGQEEGPNSSDPLEGAYVEAVVVADTYNSRVVVLPWTGNGWGTQYTLGTVGLNDPSGVTVATYTSDGDPSYAYFIADTNNSRVVEYLQTPTGNSQSTVPLSGINHPWGVALAGGFDTPSSYGLLVSDTNNNRLVYFVEGAQYVVPASGLNQPTGLSQSLDNCGNEFVADTNNNRVLAESGAANGQVIMPFSGLNQPNGTDAGDGYVFAADSNNSRIVEIANPITCKSLGPFRQG
jgi:hypothetical protein